MFQATQKLKLFSILEDMRVAMPGLADQLGNDYTDDTMLVRKAAPSKILDVEMASRIIVGKITTLDIDTYNEVVMPEGMDKTSYVQNNVVLWGHNYMDHLPHGENVWLRAYPANSPVEVRAATKYYEGSPAAKFPNNGEIFDYRAKRRPLGYSIGFIPKQEVNEGSDEWDDVLEDWQDRYAAYKGNGIKKADIPTPAWFYTEWIILEYSDVVVPANPGAVAFYVEKGFIKPEEVEEYTIQPADEDVDLATVDGMKNTDEWVTQELKDYVQSVLKETEKFRQSFTPKNPVDVDGDPPADDANISEAVKTAVSEAFEKVAMTDVEINVPEALKEFNISTLIAEKQGRLE